MLILQKCRVLMVPKTGSQWLAQALKKACDVWGEWPQPHLQLVHAPRADLPTLAGVRHPVTWYQSYWNHRMRNSDWNDQYHDIDQPSMLSDRFEVWMERVLERYPGWLSVYMRKWHGPEGSTVRPVQFEDMANMLCLLFNELGQNYDANPLYEDDRVNAGDYDRFPTNMPPKLAERVCEAEVEMLQRFYS